MYDSPLEMDYFIEEKLELMRDAGIDRMDDEQVPISLREKRKAADLSQTDLERLTRENGNRVPKSSISDIENGKRSDPEAEDRLHDGVDGVVEQGEPLPDEDDAPDATTTTDAPPTHMHKVSQ
jgi:hypothetical protein